MARREFKSLASVLAGEKLRIRKTSKTKSGYYWYTDSDKGGTVSEAAADMMEADGKIIKAKYQFCDSSWQEKDEKSDEMKTYKTTMLTLKARVDGDDEFECDITEED
jgi:hypothetical protein